MGESQAGHSPGDLNWPLRRAAVHFADAVAILDGDRSLSYAELARRTALLGGALQTLGVRPGARVGFLGVNSLAHVECFLGVPGHGRVLVDLNFRLALAELEFIVRDCEIEVLVVDVAQLEVGRQLRERCASIRQLVLDGPLPCPDDCLAYEQLLTGPALAPHDLEGDTLAVISYTGGTTGSPKGVMLSHANLLANARNNLIATGHHVSDCWLHVCPMFHVAGTANLLACTWVGARQVLLPRFDARSVIDAVRAHDVTHMVLVPTMLAMLLDELDADGGELPSLKHIQYAASPISPALQRRVLDRFACDIVEFYGMTEAAPTVSSLSARAHRLGHGGVEPHASRLASIGIPVIGVEAELRGADRRPVAAGEVGELWVRGENVMLGYWNRPDATASALFDGWYATGDAARADEDGYLFLLDRLKDMIVSGGENIYSIEVEAALMQHQAVLEAAVFGVPDPRWGEAVHAVVCVRDGSGVTDAELIEHCRRLIAGYKLPRTLDVRSGEALPRSGAGKVLKHVLREPFWAGHERRVS